MLKKRFKGQRPYKKGHWDQVKSAVRHVQELPDGGIRHERVQTG